MRSDGASPDSDDLAEDLEALAVKRGKGKRTEETKKGKTEEKKVERKGRKSSEKDEEKEKEEAKEESERQEQVEDTLKKEREQKEEGQEEKEETKKEEQERQKEEEEEVQTEAAMAGGEGKGEKTHKPDKVAESQPAEGGEEEGAVGGAVGHTPSSGTTVEEFLGLKGVDQMFTVTPLTWCPHLSSVVPPPQPLDVRAPCEQCGDCTENWVCLTCYTVLCSRFRQEHMLFHSVESSHYMVLSYSDLSVWCYACDSYIHNEALTPAKASAYLSKFGEAMPGI